MISPPTGVFGLAMLDDPAIMLAEIPAGPDAPPGSTVQVAVKVKDGTNTASPRPTSWAISAMIRAVVPLEQEMTCLAPQRDA